MNSYVVLPRFSVHAALSQSWLSPKQAFALAGSSLPLPPSSVLPPPPSSSEGSGHAETESAARQRHSMTQHTKVICCDNGYDNGYDISCRDAIHCLEPKLLWGTKCAKQTGGWWFGWPAKSANTCGLATSQYLWSGNQHVTSAKVILADAFLCVCPWVSFVASLCKVPKRQQKLLCCGNICGAIQLSLGPVCWLKENTPTSIGFTAVHPFIWFWGCVLEKRGSRQMLCCTTRSEHRYNVDASWFMIDQSQGSSEYLVNISTYFNIFQQFSTYFNRLSDAVSMNYPIAIHSMAFHEVLGLMEVLQIRALPQAESSTGPLQPQLPIARSIQVRSC